MYRLCLAELTLKVDEDVQVIGRIVVAVVKHT